jgi:Tol biopolymer transport system component
VSDRGGAENIWQTGTAAGSAPRQLTRFTTDARCGRPYERGDAIVSSGLRHLA